MLVSARRTSPVVAIALAASAAALPAQSSGADVWQRVPPPVTSCFPDDAARQRLGTLSEQLGKDYEQQKERNAAARERFDNMDMGEKSQRMQAFMMKNPQAAATLMQATQGAGNTAQTTLPEVNEATQRLDQEFKGLESRLRGAVEQAAKPIRERQGQFIKAKTVLVGEVQEPAFTTAADHAQYVRLIDEENAAIEKACAPFFGAGGAVHDWLARYRRDVSEKLIAIDAEGDALIVLQMQAMGLSGDAYRSAAPYQRVQQYVGRMLDADGLRPTKARATVGLRK